MTHDLTSLAALREPRALLFDLDGTLVDTVGRRIEAWTRALAGIGLTPQPAVVGGYIGSDGRFLAKEVARRAGRELDEATASDVDRVSGAIFDEINVSPAPLPGAHDLLAALEESHLTFSIATSSLPGQVAVSVSALRLPAPPPIVDGSHVTHAKPDPELLLTAAAQLGVPPEACWYVGDATWDMLAASRAGMVAIGVPTGAADASALMAAGATVSIASLEVLLESLRERGLVA
jgi:HAD superfamily hydrolase (TIGR01509 family)